MFLALRLIQLLKVAKKMTASTALVLMAFGGAAHSQNLMGFDRASFGSVVLSQNQSAGSEIQLESAIGLYNNEPILNYGNDSVFARIGKSVGRLDVLTDKGNFPCTSFIVSKKYILTNYHCSFGMLDNERIGATRIDATQFVAGYTQTGIDEGTNRYTVIPTPVEFSAELDYAVLEVLGNPSQKYGKLNLVNLVPKDRTPFWVIGHPNGEGQRISREKCRASAPAVSKNKLLHTCDTLPGNSGSPVIDAGLQVVVALHHAGISNESVNAAILMSEILANSSVLAAYKAPVNVVKPTDTVEQTACDALYSAASEAKACFAYEAYVKSCRGHALAPIAEGYIEKFCQVQKITQIEPKPTQTCSQDAKQCGDEQICSLATKNGRWNTSSVNQFYVQEAKKRGLTCGVSEIIDTNFRQAFVSQSKLKRQQLQYALKKLGYYSFGFDGLWGKGTATGFDKFVKRYSLQTKTAVQVFSSLLSKVTVPSSFESKAAKIPKTSTDKNAPCYLNFKNCTVKQLCITATKISDGQTTWLTTRYPFHVEEAKRRGLNCGVRQNLIPKRITRKVGSKPMRCFDPSRGIVYSHSPYGMNCSAGDYAISDEDFFKLQGR